MTCEMTGKHATIKCVVQEKIVEKDTSPSLSKYCHFHRDFGMVEATHLRFDSIQPLQLGPLCRNLTEILIE